MLNLIPAALLVLILLFTYRHYLLDQHIRSQNQGLELGRQLARLFQLVQRHKLEVDAIINGNPKLMASCKAKQKEIKAVLGAIGKILQHNPELQPSQQNMDRISTMWRQLSFRVHRDLTLNSSQFLHAQLTSQIRKSIQELPDNTRLYWTEPGKVVRLVLQLLPSLSYYLTQARDALIATPSIAAMPGYSQQQLRFITRKIHGKLAEIRAVSLDISQTRMKSLPVSLLHCQQLLQLLETQLEECRTPGLKPDGHTLSESAEKVAEEILATLDEGILEMEGLDAAGTQRPLAPARIAVAAKHTG